MTKDETVKKIVSLTVVAPLDTWCELRKDLIPGSSFSKATRYFHLPSGFVCVCVSSKENDSILRKLELEQQELPECKGCEESTFLAAICGKREKDTLVNAKA